MKYSEWTNLLRQSRLVAAKGWDSEKKWQVTVNEYRVSFWGDANVLKLICSDSCITLRLYQKNPTALFILMGELYGM